MRHLTRLLLAAALVGTTVAPARALDGYSEAETSAFMDWCTGAKTTAPSVCSCAVQRLATTVPAAALSSFLQSQQGSGFSLSTAAVTTAATVTDAIVACSQ